MLPSVSRHALALSILAALLVGCSGGRVDSIESELNDVKRQVSKLQKEQGEHKAQLETLAADVEQVRKVTATTNADADSVEASIESLTERLNDTNGRIDRLSARLGAGSSDNVAGTASIPLPEAARAPSATGQPPDQMYAAASADYAKGNYALALLEYQELLAQFPDNDLADNAQFGIAECYFAQKRYEDAIRELDRIFAKHAKSDKVPAAYLKKGFAFLELNQTAQGVVQLQYLISKFPKSDEAQVARRRLESMGLKPR